MLEPEPEGWAAKRYRPRALHSLSAGVETEAAPADTAEQSEPTPGAVLLPLSSF